jgi:hypothetical protein
MSTFNLQYGKTVNSSGINLAWIAPPPLTPNENCLITNAVTILPANVPGTVKDIVLYTGALSARYEDETIIGIDANLKEFTFISSKMNIVEPVADETDAWHVRITDGLFRIKTKYTTSIHTTTASSQCWLDKAATEEGWVVGQDIVLIYTIPEITAQPYLSDTIGNVFTDYGTLTDYGLKGLPIVDEVAAFVDDFNIATNNGKLYEVSSIKVNTQELLVTPVTYLTQVLPETIQNIDWANGIIKLKTSIDIQDTVEVSYKYTQDSYIFRGYYDDVLQKYCDLDLNPSYGHTYDNGKESRNLLASVVYIFLLPSAAYAYSPVASGNLKLKTGLRYTNQFVRWESGPAITLDAIRASGVTDNTTGEEDLPFSVFGKAIYDKNKFVSTFPTDSSMIFNEDGSVGENLQAGGVGSLTRYPFAIVLAKLYVSPNGTIETVRVVDTRTRGGGVPEDAEIRRLKLSGTQLQELSSYFDISTWDGEPAMLNGVIVVEVPKEILTGTAGLKKFTEAEVQAIVDSHVAAGVKGIVRYV